MSALGQTATFGTAWFRVWNATENRHSGRNVGNALNSVEKVLFHSRSEKSGPYRSSCNFWPRGSPKSGSCRVELAHRVQRPIQPELLAVCVSRGKFRALRFRVFQRNSPYSRRYTKRCRRSFDDPRPTFNSVAIGARLTLVAATTTQ